MSGSGTFAVAGVTSAWCVFALIFLFRRWSRRGASQARASVAWVGTLLQAVALGLFWGYRRAPLGAPVMAAHPAANLLIVVAAVALAWIGVGVMVWAIHTLGRQWAVAARLVEGHELVTAGPYRFVRNPVYTGFFGLAIATGVVFSQRWTLLVGVPLFFFGTVIRVNAEERLLRARFGPRYDAFVRRVPALLPRIRPWAGEP